MTDQSDILRRVPPQNIEAEESVLGAILLENDAVDEVLDELAADDFYRESHRLIYLSMLALHARKEAIDAVTLHAALKGAGVLEQVGGLAYIAELAARVPTAANVGYYATLVKTAARYRNIGRVATAIARDIFEAAQADIEQFADRAARDMLSACESGAVRGPRPVKDFAASIIGNMRLARQSPGAPRGLTSGLIDYDAITSGLLPSDLIFIAGRPSMGKSALAHHFARVNALAGKSTLLFSLEMTAEAILGRMACALGVVDSSRLRAGYIGDAEEDRIIGALGMLATSPLQIDDSSDLTPLELRARARRVRQRHGLDLVIVDYLQLMAPDERNVNREREVAAICRALKALAKELEIPVVALSQLNRQVETRTDRRPLLADLRESGSIEQDADVIAFIYRDEVYHKDSKAAGTAEIIVAKQRVGPTGTAIVTWQANYGRFLDYSAADAPAGSGAAYNGRRVD